MEVIASSFPHSPFSHLSKQISQDSMSLFTGHNCSCHYNCADKKAFKDKIFLLSVEAERILLYIVLTCYMALGGVNVVLKV